MYLCIVCVEFSLQRPLSSTLIYVMTVSQPDMFIVLNGDYE